MELIQNNFGLLVSVILYFSMYVLSLLGSKYFLFNTAPVIPNAMAVVFTFLLQYSLTKKYRDSNKGWVYLSYTLMTAVFLNIFSSFLIQFFYWLRELQGETNDMSAVIIYPLMILISICWGVLFDRMRRKIVVESGS
jgi:apolipoprotein N-acyltransferase